MTTLLGIVMIYAWIHAGIIIGKKIHGLTGYEKTILIVGLVAFVLYLIGTIQG